MNLPVPAVISNHSPVKSSSQMPNQRLRQRTSTMRIPRSSSLLLWSLPAMAGAFHVPYPSSPPARTSTFGYAPSTTALQMLGVTYPSFDEMVAGGERYEMVPLPDSMCTTTLWVGNLCEFTTDEQLSGLFSEVSVLSSLPACVARKPNASSRKYGFVTFPSVEEKEVRNKNMTTHSMCYFYWFEFNTLICILNRKFLCSSSHIYLYQTERNHQVARAEAERQTDQGRAHHRFRGTESSPRTRQDCSICSRIRPQGGRPNGQRCTHHNR